MAFIGPIPEGYEVNHIDGNKENNALENLEYVTRRQNIQHAIQTLGRDWKSPKNAGGTHGMAKLTETDVVRLRTLHAEGWRLPRLAQEFGVGIASVSMIVNRKTWRHI